MELTLIESADFLTAGPVWSIFNLDLAFAIRLVAVVEFIDDLFTAEGLNAQNKAFLALFWLHKA